MLSTHTRPESYRDGNIIRTGNGPTQRFRGVNTRYEFITNDNCRDVTDNKTSDSNPVFNILESITPLRDMNDDLLYMESERLKTFERWPLNFIDKNILARTGIYYLGTFDNTKCYFCEIEIGRWEITDNPLTEHIRFSPNCPLLRRRNTNNIPIDPDALDRILPPPSYDVCGRTEMIDIRPTAYAESSTISSVPTLSQSTTTTTTTSTTTSSSLLYPDHPEYAIESARLRSFSEWPRTMKQKPHQLSEAGFFYTGIGDRVKCFSCGGGLKDWDEGDDPWEQHALWLSNCAYLKLMKGKSYVESVLRKYKSPNVDNKQNIQATSEESSCSTSSSSSSSSSSSASSLLLTNGLNSAKTDVNNGTSTSASSQINKNSSDEKEKVNDEKLCKICFVGEYDTAFLPCGHVVACAKCASSVTKCPLCRKPFTDIIRVYFS